MSLFGGEGVPFTSQSVTKSWSAVTRRKGRTGDLPYVRQYPAFLTDNLDVLRARSKWLTRNNAHAAGVARDLADQLVGSTGVVPGIEDMTWRRWADDPAQCDHQMRLPLVGMLWAAARAQIVSGEAFVVVRTLRSDSPWPLPLRFDVLDGDALGYGVHAGYGGFGGTAGRVARGARIQQGIEYGASGRRLAYHFHTPSKFYYGDEPTVRVEAVEVFHLYEPLEPGMERGAPWLAPVILKLSDLGAFEEATLKKAEIASQIVAITSRLDGVDASLLPSESDDDALATPYELRVSPGNEVKAMPEQKTAGVKDFADAILSGAAAGVGTVFEDLTGDYRNMPFSAARLSSLKQERRTKGRRKRGIEPLARWMYAWCRRAAAVRGLDWPEGAELDWIAPPTDMVDPDKEVRAALARVRAGFTTLSDEIRRFGREPQQHLEKLAAEQGLLDKLNLVLDSDPRRLTAQGQAQQVPEPDDGDGARA